MKKLVLTSVSAVLLAAHPLLAQTPITWDGDTDTTFLNGANWGGGVAPANSNVTNYGVFSGIPTANQPNMTAARTIAGLDFQTAGWTLSGGFGLTLGAFGIDSAGSGTNLITAPIAISNSISQTWSIGSGNTLEVSSILSGGNSTSAIIVDGAGKLVLSGASNNTFQPSITLTNGADLDLNKTGALAFRAGVTTVGVGNGSTVKWLQAAQSEARTIFNVGTGGLLDLNGLNATFAFSGNEKITLSGGTVQTGAGTWTFGGNNGQAAIVNGATVSTITGNVDFGGATTARTVSVDNNASGLDLNWGANILQGGTLTVAGVALNQGAEVSLGGNNSGWAGALAITNGATVYLDHANAAGTGGSQNTVANGSVLALRGGINYAETAATQIQFSPTGVAGFRSVSGNNTWNGDITNPGGSTPFYGNIQVDADTLTMAGSLSSFIVSNNRQLAKLGEGALVYTNSANITGNIKVAGGNFTFTEVGDLAAANTIRLDGGTIGNVENFTRSLGTGGSNVVFGSAGGGFAAYNTDVEVNIGGAAGTLIWGGASDALMGTTISGGVVTFAGVTFSGGGYTSAPTVTFSASPGVTATGTAVLNANGGIESITVTDPGSGYASAPTITLSAPAGDGGTANFLSNGAPLILNSTVSTNKVTLKNNLFLADAGASFTGEREIRVIDNPNSTTDRAVIDATIASPKSGVGINKTGDGLLELAASNSNFYDGNTIVSAGTLLVNGSIIGGGNVTVASGAALGGNGSLDGASAISGSLRPGDGGIGTLTIVADTTWNAGNAWQFDLGTSAASLALAASGSSTQDMLDLTGGVDFLKGTGSSFVFDFDNTGSVGWYKLVDWDGSTTFSALDFTATNVGSGLAGTFTVDATTSALYLNVNVIPEPSTALLLGGGLMFVMLMRRRRA